MRNVRQHHRLTFRPGLLAAAGLALSSLVGCQHAEEARDLADLAEKVRSGEADGTVLVSGPRYETEGMDPTTALATSETVVTDPAPPEPVVVEDERMSCGDVQIRDVYVPDPAVEAEADALISQMSIQQKVVQLTGLEDPGQRDSSVYEDIQRSRDDETLNIRGYLWRDGPHGLNLESGLGRSGLENYATSFPVSVAQGATFDMDLAYRLGEAMADETAAAGQNVLLGPCMNILRHPYWGRAQETFGEDTFHLGRIGTAVTLGIQEHMTGCAKHYTANNIENGRAKINSQMDEQTLREVYGRHFEMVVRDGGVGCMMAAYNQVNRVKSTQNKHTLNEMLRVDMGFRGFVLTDWWAMPGPNNGQGPTDAPVDRENAGEALAAGLDVEVPWSLNYDAIPSIVADGTISEELVNTSVRRVLEQKLRFNTAYIDGPIGLKETRTTYDSSRGSIVNTDQHVALATEAAEKSMVLLKNDTIDGDKKALPITDATTVAVLGETINYFVRPDNPQFKDFHFHTDAALGDRGSSRVSTDPELTYGPLRGIQEAAPEGVTVIGGTSAEDAADADFIVVVVGLTPGDEGEEYTGAADRESLALATFNVENEDGSETATPVQDDLIRAAAQLGKPMVVIIEAGGVVDMPWLDQVDAAVMAWYPGQTGGLAMGRLLFGESNFSGRLPVTWPASADQFPTFNEGDTTFMDYFVGYRLFDEMGMTPLYAFGHGLSYSTFSYERLYTPCGTVSKNALIHVEVDVRNTAGPAGDEVILLFASYPETTVRRSKKELKGFARVSLEEGEAKRVSIPLRIEDLKRWEGGLDGNWVVENGPVLLQVGPSSDNLPLQQTITVQD